MQLIKYFILFISGFFSLAAKAQSKPDSLFADFNFKPLVPSMPVSTARLITPGSYIRKESGKKSSSIELIKVYKDSSIGMRKATLKQLSYGNVLVFKTLKTPGYEKVFIFADWDYYNDSLLICHDTLYFKQTTDDNVSFTVLFPEKNDTVTLLYGYRTTRYDFLKKIYFEPPLKAYRNWFPDTMFDYTETFTLLKKDTYYELIKVETEGSDKRKEEYQDVQKKYAAAGLSPFWLVLSELAYQDKKK